MTLEIVTWEIFLWLQSENKAYNETIWFFDFFLEKKEK
jgi:hypothetical protein